MNRRTEPAHILVVAPQPFYEDRGTPIAIRRLLEALSERGDTVDLLTFPVGDAIDLPGLTTFRIPNLFRIRRVPIGLSLRKVLLDLTMAPILFNRVRRIRYSSIHAVEESAFLAVLAARKPGIPVIYDMQSSLPEQLAKFKIFRVRWIQSCFRRLEHWLIRNSANVVCSAGLKPYVDNIKGSSESTEWQFPASQSTTTSDEQQDLRKELAISPQNQIVLYSGTFEQYQGLDILLKAAVAVVAEIPQAVFVFVGASNPAHFMLGPDADALSEMSALKIVARKPRTEINRYLAIADLLVSPRSHGGNVPLKIFDYMAAGKPILASDCIAHRAVLDESRAILIDSSPTAWSSAIIRALKNPKETDRLVLAAKAFADQRLGWKEFQQSVWTLHNKS